MKSNRLLEFFKKSLLVLSLATLFGQTKAMAQSGYGDFIIFEDFGRAVPSDAAHEYYPASQNNAGGIAVPVYFRVAPLADINPSNLLFYRPGNPPLFYWVPGEGDLQSRLDHPNNWGPQYRDDAQIGSYSIVTDSRGYRDVYFHEGLDHTPGDGEFGYMLLVDAHSSTTLYFEREIEGLCAGTRFEFSAWVKDVNSQGSVRPRVRFDILNAKNDAVIHSYSSEEEDVSPVNEWNQITTDFEIPAGINTVKLRITNIELNDQGNDIAIDDIGFRAMGPSINFQMAPESPVCIGSTVTFTANISDGNEAYPTNHFVLQRRAAGSSDPWNNVGGYKTSNGTDPVSFSIEDVNLTHDNFDYRVIVAGDPTTLDSDKCRAVSDPLLLRVQDHQPQITVEGGVVAICADESIVLNTVINGGIGTPAYTYVWERSVDQTDWQVIGGQSGPSLNTGSLSQTTYYRVTARVGNQDGCAGAGASDVFEVEVTPIPGPPVSGGDLTECEQTPIQTLTATATVPEGHTVVWYDTAVDGNPVASPTLSAVATVTYYAASRLGLDGCESTSRTPVTLVITAPPSLPVATVVHPTCEVATGTITVTAITGAEYSINGTDYQSLNVFTGVAAGTYNVTARFVGVDCVSASTGVTVNAQPEAPSAPVIASVIHPTCEVATGTITVTAITGAEYSINGTDYQSLNVFTGVAAGTYNVTARFVGVDCVSASTGVTVNAQPETPSVPVIASVIHPTCEVATGTITVTAITGAEYSINGTDYQSLNVFTGVAAGTYNVTARFVGVDCVSASTGVTVNAQPEAPSAPVIASVIHPTCEVATGTITVTAITGAEYSINGTDYQSLNVFTGVAAGTYNVTARFVGVDCVSASTGVTVNAQPEAPSAPVIASVIHPTCEVATGTITVTAITGAEYSINGTDYQSLNVFTGVAAGTYNVTARFVGVDCVSASTGVTVNAQPETPSVPVIASVIHPTCEVATGTITVTAITGAEYSINGTDYQSLNVFTGVAAGTYNVTARFVGVDCVSASTGVTVNAQPETPSVPVIASVIHPTCEVATGTITVTAITGAEYSINGTDYQTSNVFENVAAGTHTITARFVGVDCVSASTGVTVNAQPEAPSAPVIASVIHPTCEVATGTITVTAITGAEYSINGTDYQTSNVFENVAAGTHTITARFVGVDCVSASTGVTVNAQPEAPSAPVIASVIHPTCEVATGTITVTAITGAEYSINGTDYQTSNVFENVAAGTHTITARFVGVDCVSASTGVTVNAQPEAPSAPVIASVIHPTCEVATGTITVTAITGAEYSINGTDYQTSNVFENVAAGTHTITARFVGVDCVSASTDVTVNAQPEAPSAPISGGDQTECESSPVQTLTASVTVPVGHKVVWYDVDGNVVFLPTLSTVGTVTYYASSRVGEDGCESILLTSVTLTITSVEAPVTNKTMQEFCGIDAPTVADLQATGDNIRWYDAATGGSVVAPGTALIDGTTYYATQTVDGCESVTRLAVTVLLNAVDGGVISGVQTICLGTVANTIVSSTLGTGTGDITYRWEVSIDNGNTWSTVVGAVTEAYAPGALNETSLFRRVAISVQNGAACEAYSNVVAITINTDCDITSEKSVADESNDALAQAGEELTYSIVVYNNYDRDIEVTIADQVPTNTTFVSNSSGGIYNEGDNLVLWSDVLVPANSRTTVSFVVQVAENLTGISIIENIALVTGSEISTPQTPKVDINTDPTRTFTSVKTADKTSVRAGEELTYTITVTNTGDVDYAGITVSDAIPANTTYKEGSASAGSSLSGNTLGWTVDVPFGGSREVSFTVVVDTDLTGITTIRNVAVVTGDDPTTPEEPEVEVPVDPTRSFTSVKTADKTSVRAGEELTYTITVTNTGDVDYAGITVSDAVPANTTYKEGSASAGSSLANGALNWTVDVPFGGSREVSFTVVVDADLTGITTIRNVAVVTGDDPETPEEPEVEVPVDPTRSFTSVKTADKASVKAGEELTYTITVTNTGDVDYAGITISDAIPANTTYKEGSASAGSSLANGALNWTVDVPFGESREVSFTVVVASDLTGIATIRNVAVVTGDDPETPEEPEVEVPVDPTRSFTSVKTADKTSVRAGEELTYTITVTNTGDVDYAGITISDAVPANTTYKEGSASAGSSLSGNTLGWTVDVPFGGSREVSFTVVVDTDLTGIATIRNVAVVTGDDPETPEEPEVEVPVDPTRSFTSVKTADKTSVRAGEELTYTITVTNTGDVDYAGITVSDAVPANTTYKEGSASAGSSLANGALNWTVDVPFGGSREVSFTVVVDADLTGITTIRNVAVVTGDDPETPEEPEVEVPVDPTRSFTSVKTADKASVKAGEELTYTITVTNTGDVDYAGITVSDAVPANTTYKEGSASAGSSLANGALNWTVDVPFGGSREVSFTVVVDTDLTGITTIRNVAVVTGDDPETPEEPEVEVPVDPTRSFTSVKTADKTSVRAGEELTYTITVTNTGDVDYAGITVSDAVPANTTYKEGSASAGSSLANGALNWTVDVPFGGSREVSFTVVVDTDLTGITTIRNVAVVTGDDPETPEEPEVEVPVDPTRSFTSVKTADKASVKAGEELTYTITVTNTGDVDYAGVTVSDAIPANTTYKEGSASAGSSLANGALNWTVDVPFGESREVSFTVVVASDLTGIATIRNVAVVTGDDPETPEEPEVEVPVDPTRSFTSVKTADKTSVRAGEELTYTITVTNTGDVDYAGITISDAVPANTTYKEGSASAGSSLSGNTLGWTVDVPFGGSREVSFTVVVDTDLTGITTIRNVAVVTGDDPETPEEPEVEVPVDPTRSFTSVKTADKTSVKAGEELTYTITVTNTGDVDYAGITISDAVPANTTYKEGSASAGSSLANGALNWTVDVPFGGSREVSFKVVVDADLTGISTIRNVAVVTGDDPETPEEPEVEVPVDPTRSFTSVKTADKTSVRAGEELTYTITVTNTGDVDYAGITISDAVPANTTYKEGSASAGSSLANGALNWTVDVPFGESREVSFTVVVASDLTGIATIRNVAVVTGDDPETPEEPEVEVPVDPTRSFTSVKTADKTSVRAGEELTYTITVTNTGDVDYAGITISDAVPANTTYKEGSASAGSSLSGNTLGWTVDVPFGGSREVSFTVVVDTDLTGIATIRNVAVVTGDDPETPEEPEVEVPVDPTRSFTSVKTADKTSVRAGEELTYTITVTNTGDVDYAGITVSDAVPANTTYKEGSASAGSSLANGALNWTVDVPFGGSREVSFTVVVDADLTGITTIRNVAVVTGDDPETPEEPEVEVPVDPTRSFTSVKTADKASVKAGEELTYTITVTNTGDVDYAGITVSDAVPANTTYKEGSASAGSSLANGALNWTVDVPFGGSREVSFTVVVDTDLTGITTIRNVAVVTGDDPETPEEPEVEVPVDPTRSFTSVKTADKTSVRAGEELTYTITVTNTGDVDYAGITVSDAVPANTTYKEGSASAGSSLANGALNWTVDVPFGGSREVSFTVVVDTDLTGITTIRNVAVVTGDDPETPEEPEVEVPVDPTRSFTSVKTADKTSVRAGEELTYTITVTNTGDVDYAGITVSDAVPANTTYKEGSASAGSSLANGALNWTVDVPFGGSREVSFTVVVDADLTGITTIRNVAVVTGDDPETPEEPEVEVPVDPTRSFTSVKTADKASVKAGEELTYTITVTNTGDVDYAGITVSDAVPANTTYKEGSASAGSSLANGALNWTVDVPFGGSREVSFTVVVDTDLTGITTIRNVAVVTGDDPETPEEPEVEVPVDPTRSFTSVKTADKTSVRAGEELTYTITVTNTGDVDYAGITVSDAVPANTTYKEGSASAGSSLANGALNWTVDVPFGGSREVSFTVVVDTDLTGITTIRNVAVVTGDDPETPEEPEVEVPVDPTRSFTSVKTADKASVKAGEELTYTITVTNTGDVDYAGVTVSDAIPANTTYKEGSASAGSSLANGALNWTVDVPFGESREVSFTVVVDTDLTGITTIRNVAVVTGDDPETPEEPEVEVPVDPTRSFTSVKTADKTSVRAGEELTYTITVTNTGDVDYAGITISDAVPANTTYKEGSASAGSSLANGALNWTVDVPFGESREVSFTVVVDTDLTGITTIRNVAVVTGDDPETPEEPEVEVPVDPTRSFTSVKTADKTSVRAGEELTYTITVTNTGDVDYAGITISDAVPANTTYKEGSASAGSSLANGALNWTVDVPFGGSREVSFTVVVDTDLTGITTIRNVAVVTGDDPETPEEPEVEVPVDPTRSFTSVKTVSDATGDGNAQAGEELTYTITVKNTGAEDYKGILITDNIPAHTAYVAGTATNGGTFANERLTWTIDLAYEQTVSVSFKVKVSVELEGVDFIRNIATVTGGDPEKPEVENPESPEVPVITGPVANPDEVSTDQGEPVTVEVVTNDNVGSAPIVPGTVRLIDPVTGNETTTVTIGGEGTYIIDAIGKVIFTPEADFVGTSTVNYTVKDENGLTSNEAAITITVEGVAAEVSPTAVDDTKTTQYRQPTTIDVIANDIAGSSEINRSSVKFINPAGERVTSLTVPGQGVYTVNNQGIVTFTPAEGFTGVSVVDYEVTDANGLVSNVAKITVTVNVRPFKIPNVFTPNGDGKNEEFEIVGIEGFDRVEITVVNRWGNEVYRNNNYRNNWNGQGLNEGTYYYVIITHEGGRQERHTGWVLIKRQ